MVSTRLSFSSLFIVTLLLASIYYFLKTMICCFEHYAVISMTANTITDCFGAR